MLILLWENVRETHDDMGNDLWRRRWEDFNNMHVCVCVSPSVCVSREREREVLQESINIAFLCLMDVWHIFMFPQQIPLSYFPFCQSSTKQQILTIIPEKLLIKTTLFCLLLSSITHTDSASLSSYSRTIFIWFQRCILHHSSVQMQRKKKKITFTKCLRHLYFTHFVMSVCRCTAQLLQCCCTVMVIRLLSLVL